MDKEKFKNDFILPRLKKDEELIGFFQATYVPSLWWIFLIGPFAVFGTKIYCVAVTNQGLHLYKLNFFSNSKIDVYNFIPYSEISEIKLGNGFLQAPLKLVLVNGKKLVLKAQLKGIDKLAKLEDKTKEFLLSKSPIN